MQMCDFIKRAFFKCVEFSDSLNVWNRTLWYILIYSISFAIEVYFEWKHLRNFALNF